ncbi:MAG: metal-sulfur cluster assembly factor, partial [Candidatus Magasanikbacteria bacterium]|nr:metal-sulfur cluster assembly factor [Candidatus Magasanikbacteria bacterium]
IIEELKRINDPELFIDIYTLGLIYEVNIKSKEEVHVLMTFTTPMCPAGDMLRHQVESAMRRLGFSAVDLEITFEPPWKPTAELREMLGV